MRNWKFWTTVVAASFVFSSAAMSAEPWYVSGSVGGVFRQDYTIPDDFSDFHYPSYNSVGTEKRSYSPGVLTDVAVGYHVLPNLRVEAELGYIGYEGHTITITESNTAEYNTGVFHHRSGDDFSRTTGAVNAFYDFAPLAGLFTPYIGVGAGAAAEHRTAGFYSSASNADYSTYSLTSTEGFGQVEGGLTFALPGHWSLSPAYRYMHFVGPNADVAHVAKVSLRYSF